MAGPAKKIAIGGWLLLGAGITFWLARKPNGSTLLIQLLLIVPFLGVLVAMLRQARNSFAYAMLAAIVYAVVSVMELVSLASLPLPAALMTASALIAFFTTIPATRLQSRKNNRESNEH